MELGRSEWVWVCKDGFGWSWVGPSGYGCVRMDLGGVG